MEISTNYNFQNLMKYVTLILHSMGTWPITYYDTIKPKCYLYRIYGWFAYFALITTSFGEVYYTYTNIKDFDLILESVADLLGSLISIYQISVILWKRYDVYKLLYNILKVRSLMPLDENLSEIKRVEENSYREAYRVTMAMLSLIGGTIVFYFIRFFISMIVHPVPYDLPYRNEFPFEWRHPFTYIFIFILNIFASISYVCVLSGIPALYATLVIFICTQFKILKLSISKSTNAQNQLNKQLNNTTLSKIDNSHTLLLKHSIRHHQAIFKFCEDLESIFSPCIFTQFILSGVTLSFVAYQLTQVSTKEEIFKYGLFFAMIIGTLFVYCWYGEKITTESESIGICAYNTKWYNMSTNFKSLIFIIIFRSQKSIYLTAMGYLHANLFAFSQLVKASASYFALLQTVNEEQ